MSSAGPGSPDGPPAAARRPLLVLVGPPSSGKTTVGTALAGRLGIPFRDTDSDVEAATGQRVADLFVDLGEAHFRGLEQQAVATALGEHEGVLALGGGAVLSAATRELLTAYTRAGGTVVWLDVDLASAAERVGLSRSRPVLGLNPRATLRTLLAARAPLYAEVATVTVTTGGREPGEVVDEVATAVVARQVTP
ncbi:shikimate kinase [Geodermatophilus sp. DSM 45219]|uniref:shikimate kinase n=1 Tax=Geodermatophilus sp. DSM 45219 TaxID=1881103 RepID=UPI000890A9B4|nr:shikimate kinase [Geodermatophilus sp. DSM 45219]SDO55655.1 shikimate kinase [Geodermatophilus sp. DSM 45219]